jgi:hypothetical protein
MQLRPSGCLGKVVAWSGAITVVGISANHVIDFVSAFLQVLKATCWQGTSLQATVHRIAETGQQHWFVGAAVLVTLGFAGGVLLAPCLPSLLRAAAAWFDGRFRGGGSSSQGPPQQAG